MPDFRAYPAHRAFRCAKSSRLAAPRSARPCSKGSPPPHPYWLSSPSKFRSQPQAPVVNQCHLEMRRRPATAPATRPPRAVPDAAAASPARLLAFGQADAAPRSPPAYSHRRTKPPETSAGTAPAATSGCLLQGPIEPVQSRSRASTSPASVKSSTARYRARSSSSRTASAGALRQHVPQREEIAQALGHLLAVHLQHAVMQPVSREMAARKRAQALRPLILMMRKNQIRPAAMNIEILAQISPGHGTALDMPARPPAPPRALPPRQRHPASRASTARNPPHPACTAPPPPAPPPADPPGERPDSAPYEA